MRAITVSLIMCKVKARSDSGCTTLKTNVAPLIATEDKTNAANDKVHVENQNRGLA